MPLLSRMHGKLFSTGEGMIQRMKEAIEFHIEGLQERKTSISELSTKAVSIDVTVCTQAL